MKSPDNTHLYKVKITEYLVKEVTVRAESKEDAEYIAERDWFHSKHILTADDFSHAEYEATLIGKEEKEA